MVHIARGNWIHNELLTKFLFHQERGIHYVVIVRQATGLAKQNDNTQPL